MNHDLTRANVPHTKKILFWSDGEMSNEAFKRIKHHWSCDNKQYAQSIMSEWVVKPNPIKK